MSILDKILTKAIPKTNLIETKERFGIPLETGDDIDTLYYKYKKDIMFFGKLFRKTAIYTSVMAIYPQILKNDYLDKVKYTKCAVTIDFASDLNEKTANKIMIEFMNEFMKAKQSLPERERETLREVSAQFKHEAALDCNEFIRCAAHVNEDYIEAEIRNSGFDEEEMIPTHASIIPINDSELLYAILKTF